MVAVKTVILMFLLFSVAFLGSACSSDASLQAYRKGLYKIDKPIYDDYLAYVSEAEANHSRSPAVVFVNRKAVEKAVKFYESAASPTTRP